MKILDKVNILLDYGEVEIEKIKEFERKLRISLPPLYVNFITKHNGASIFESDFDYSDPNRDGRKNGDSLAFLRSEEIESDMKSLLKQTTEDENDPNLFKFYHYFDKWLIPFGENGGGDFICFDYRNDKTTDNPPIVIWNHDMGLKHRVIFIANNFEEFVGMLYESEEAKEDRKNWKGW
ncbi:MAG: SMI1/KNR4 family protein [Puniceicoccales bacterium]|jgi:cell wall assembly regulator SMI1|nr:SMI1/KNR4 family protein [Puniceicoccales bacterium]